MIIKIHQYKYTIKLYHTLEKRIRIEIMILSDTLEFNINTNIKDFLVLLLSHRYFFGRYNSTVSKYLTYKLTLIHKYIWYD